MATLTLREHRLSAPVSLTDRQLQSLLQAPLEVRPAGGNGLYQLKPSSFVGELWVDGLQISIRPKVDDVRTLLHMLVEAGELPRWIADQVSQPAVEGLLDLVVEMYVQAVQRIVQRGLHRAYQTHEENLGYLRGRIMPAEQLRVNAGYPHGLYCEFTEHTTDVEENRALRAVLSVIIRHRLTPKRLAPLLNRLQSAFATVSDMTFTAHSIERLKLTRLTEGYRDTLRLAALILRHLTVEQGDGGTVPFRSFLLDMNRLYERYLTVVIGHMLRGSGYQVAGQYSGYLDTRRDFRAKPDLLFFDHQNRPVLVGDLKYRAPTDGQPLQEDLYQVLAYARIWGLTQAVLIYEGVEPRQITVAGPTDRPVTIHVLQFDIAGAKADLLRGTQLLGTRILGLLRGSATPMSLGTV